MMRSKTKTKKIESICYFTFFITTLYSLYVLIIILLLSQPEPPIIPTLKYSTDLEKLRDLLEPSCTCHLDQSICFSHTEFDDYVIYLKNGNNTSSYKLALEELEHANIGCNPFHVLRRGKHQKVISYAIKFADKESILHLKRLVRSAKIYYPDWVVRVYHDGCLDRAIICELECLLDEHKRPYDNMDFCNVQQMPYEAMNVTHLPYVFWKWLPMGDLFVDTFLSRDVEACIGNREARVVNEWMDTKFLFHTIRDRPTHNKLITTGLWGMQTKQNRDLAVYLFQKLTDPTPVSWHPKQLSADLFEFEHEQQTFLKEIFDFTKRSLLIHDSFFCQNKIGSIRPFPIKRTPQYCFDTNKAYGCCQPDNKANDYYGRKDLIEKPDMCPSKCRPEKRQMWIYC